MNLHTLISANQLYEQITNPDWVIVDCHFDLDHPDAGRQAYNQAHIPGAVYAHLNQDLSGEVIPGKTGRHPLPEIGTFAQKLSEWGIDETVQVVVYDKGSGSIAARLWWMLRWLGHHSVALLDGGSNSWVEAGYPLEGTIPTPRPRVFKPAPQPKMVFGLDKILHAPQNQFLLVDSRSPERYLGESEPIDQIAGHIPGAINASFLQNLDPSQKFLSKQLLAERFSALIGSADPEQVIFYCGSGVTAAHNILAMAHAGLGFGKLFPGSWSEWILDPNRPVERSSKTR